MGVGTIAGLDGVLGTGTGGDATELRGLLVIEALDKVGLLLTGGPLVFKVGLAMPPGGYSLPEFLFSDCPCRANYT